MGLSKSFPTPNTHEPFRVVTRLAVGAPEAPLPVPVAPTAPEPLVPDVSTPEKLNTVIDDTICCESVAVTVTLVNIAGENVRQISAVPLCVFVLITRTHARFAPVTLFT